MEKKKPGANETHARQKNPSRGRKMDGSNKLRRKETTFGDGQISTKEKMSTHSKRKDLLGKSRARTSISSKRCRGQDGERFIKPEQHFLTTFEPGREGEKVKTRVCERKILQR